MKNCITATIITRNEQENMERCLNSLYGVADEIIVVDSYSDDCTLDICRKYNCKITQRKFSGYGSQKQYAISLATYTYVLSIDADEALSEDLRHAIIALKEGSLSEHRVYSMTSESYFCGEPMRHSGLGPTTQIRLFNKKYANWSLNDIDEKVTFPDTLKPVHLAGSLLHYRCSTVDEYEKKQLFHAAIHGRILAVKKKKISPMSPLWQGIKAYVGTLVKKGGILDGKKGRQIARVAYKSRKLSYATARRMLGK